MNVLMLIKTTGLEYDDRLRKEALSLRGLEYNVQIVALESANRSCERTVYGDVPARSVHLHSRRWFPQSKALWAKTPEMYGRFLSQTVRRRPDVVWAHNLELMGLMPALIMLRRLGVIRRLIWDQHELPPDRFLGNRLYMNLYRALANGCDVLVMANDERRVLVQARARLHAPVEVLHNYPDQHFRQLPRADLPPSVLAWLQGSPYVLAQGGANPGRHLRELAAAVLGQAEIKLVVVGPYQQSQPDQLNAAYGEKWPKQILFTGLVPQLEIAAYIDHALASAVFYSTSSSNSRLCAPNRLYQALSRGTPVVVGPNPPMRELVEQYGCGVVVDQGDPQSISRGLTLIQMSRAKYHLSALAASIQLDWELQDPAVQSIIGPLRRP